MTRLNLSYGSAICVSLLLMFSFSFAPVGGARAAGTATQAVRMIVMKAHVFDLPTSAIMLAVPPSVTSCPAGSKLAETSVPSRYSILESSVTSQVLTANWGSCDKASAGCCLELEADPGASVCSARGETITISPVATRVLTLTGSSFAGLGGAQGASLKYTLEASGHGSLSPGDRAVTVTLTLTDAS